VSSPETIKTYDETAKSYTDAHYTRTYWEPQYERFEKQLNAGDKILDVGCGGGRDSLRFMERGYEVTGVDLSPGMLAEAEKRVSNVGFIKMDMVDLKFPDASFDGIWCCASLLHIKRSSAHDVLRGFRRVLKENGVLFISVKEGEGDSVKECKDGNKLFFTNYSVEELAALMRGVGFSSSVLPYVGMDGSKWLCGIGKKLDVTSEKRS
jgi:ubiquinone/menaquinone biosynthesis C-methylase UbiE